MQTKIKTIVKKAVFIGAKTIAKLEANATCTFWTFQPKLPEGVQKLKK